MISSVRGPVLRLAGDAAVVEVGGVGLLVHCTPTTLAGLRVGQTATLATSLVVREDSLTLFGFADDDERAVFEAVQSVSGVGPRLAQAMLAVHTPDDLRRAVVTEDLAALTQVPGIGKKGAQRIVLELKDKLGLPAGAAPPAARRPSPGTPAAGTPVADRWRSQVHAGLVGLGWAPADADAAVEAVAGDAAAAVDASTEPSVPELLRAALRSLDRSEATR